MAEKQTKASVRKAQDAVLQELDKLADDRFDHDDIAHEGERIVLPGTPFMTKKEAVGILLASIDAEGATTEFNRQFRYRPWDVAHAFEKAVQKVTGTTGVGKKTYSFFGSTPPQRITINISPGETMDVPWGAIEIEALKATATLSTFNHAEYGILGYVTMSAPKRQGGRIDAFFKMMEHYLETESIYRGKAFDGQADPEFIDLSGVDPNQIIYSDHVTEQFQANVWSLLEYGDEMEAHGIPLKRAVLLEGPYGTGKTLGIYRTGQLALENGWTFIYCRPGRDELKTVMETARLYPPAVVAFEDVDTIASGVTAQERDHVTELLDLFDGITAKGTRLMVLMSSNHVEKLHKGMMRPGRLDAVINIAELDTNGIMRMVHALVPKSQLIEPLDEELIGGAMEGYMPAFVKEAIDRARRYSIARNQGVPGKLNTADFVLAGEGLRPQLEMMDDAKEGVPPESLDAALTRRVSEVLDRTRVMEDGDPSYDLEVAAKKS
jgi:transitional endoplasmic reticulum ATPase